MKKPTLLVVLDGLGLNPDTTGNAVAAARKPTLDRLFNERPNATLVTHGERVGLPAGQMGNSEVGHLNIGAGRVVEQWLLKISKGLSGSALSDSPAYQGFLQGVTKSKRLHLIGLYSNGGVHSHFEHAQLLVQRLSTDLSRADLSSELVLHLISDGRDVSPNRFLTDLQQLQLWMKDYPRCSIGTISGRFFAMDRDKRWERVESAYRAIACAQGKDASDPIAYVSASYAAGTTDEFLEPAIVRTAPIAIDDGVVFWNFREDRMREIVGALCIPAFDGFARAGVIPDPTRILCFTAYDARFGLPALFSQSEIRNYLGEVVSQAGLTQLRVAETEKYPHVTYFMNGGEEPPCIGEEREVVPSPRDVKTYDLKPEMSASGVTDVVVSGIESGKYDLIIVNFANCDMVGHTGNLDAAIRAVETVDSCLARVLDALEKANGQAVIIADHGNAEQMVNDVDGTPHTAHTTYPVPVIVVGGPSGITLRTDGALCDVAPTVLKLMSIPQPQEMTGQPLF
jgi:2,3-bisphosphoglycerate-independent phosphoglycerate mutase